jgi:hypothetical protein
VIQIVLRIAVELHAVKMVASCIVVGGAELGDRLIAAVLEYDVFFHSVLGFRVQGSCCSYFVAWSKVGLHPMAAIKMPLQDLAKGIHSPIVMGCSGSV